MRRRHGWIVASLAGLALSGLAGCQGGLAPKRSVPIARSEPSLAMPGDPEPDIAAAAPARRPTGIVDRHPLFSKPRDVYENAGNNKIVKVAGATIVGIPMGVFGELRQIVVGRPPEAKVR